MRFQLGLLLALLLTAPNFVAAQTTRYMDESGNIFFVDSPEDVPARYRKQVIPPTPFPELSPKERKKYLAELQKEARREEKERKRAEKEQQKKAKLIEKTLRKKAKKEKKEKKE